MSELDAPPPVPDPLTPPPRKRVTGAVWWAVLTVDLLAVVLGLLWWALSPVPQVRVDTDGAFYTDPAPREFIAADMRFLVFSLVLGVVAGLVVRWLLRAQDVVAVPLLAVGGGIGSVIAWRLGTWLGGVDLKALEHAAVGTLSPVPLQLTALGLLVVYPVSALAAWLVADLVGDFRRRDTAPSSTAEFAPYVPGEAQPAPVNWAAPPAPPGPPSA